MYFLLVCHHHKGAEIAEKRDRLRPEHRAWVASGGGGVAQVLTGSALWDAAGNCIGNFGVLQADDAAKAQAFATGDPFYFGGVVDRFNIARLADTFQADRIDPLTR